MKILRTAFFVLGLLSMTVPTWAQTITVLPNQIPNGVTSPATYKQRLNIVMGSDTGLSRSFTLTVPPEVSIVSGSVTATTDNASLVAFYSGAPSSTTLAFGLTGSTAARTVTVEFDVRTPVTFTGIASGSSQDTVYTVNFNSAFSNNSDKTPAVKLHQNKPIRFVQFASPDSVRGDTTTAGGRFHKLEFTSLFNGFGLPDLEHTGVSGLSSSRGFTDSQTDVNYAFYISSDSTLVRNSTLTPAGFFVTGADDAPLVGQRQRPRTIPATFVREDFTSTFADSTEGLISLSGTAHNTTYYVYVTSDETGDWFLGRSGPLLVKHPPVFVIAGWDYDDSSGDDYNTTGLIQVPSELIEGGGQKDNNNVTVDSGGFLSRGSAVPQTGFSTSPITSLDLLYQLEDVDNPGQVTMAIWLVPDSLNLTASDLVPTTAIDSLRNSFKLSKSDTLTANSHVFSFRPLLRDATTNLISSFIPAGDYNVYFGAKDGTNITLYKVRTDPFAAASTLATLTVGHSPTIEIDSAQFNDFGGDGDLDVTTGIGVSQMISDVDGQNLGSYPSTRIVPISWGRAGIDGDLDVDDSATIDLYYTTRSNFKVVGGSNAYSSGNSTGADLIDDISQGKTDTHRIVSGLSMTPDGQSDNLYNWDLWSYVSPENTVPRTDTKYYIYGILKGNTTQRLVSFTSAGGIVFSHPPFIQPSSPAANLNVTVDQPVMISWQAIDIDNTGSEGTVPSSGQVAPNSRTTSPNIRILLTSADFGSVTTWASVTNSANTEPLWVGNSGDGSLAEEFELNEGVDTSFVIIGNRMRNNLKSSQDLKIGVAHNVYLAIDGRGSGDQPTNFYGQSPLVKAPGTITFSGTVPTNPTTSNRFVIPKSIQTYANEHIQFPIVPEVSTHGTQIEVVNLYVTVDTTYFTPIDMDPSKVGVQPFTAGTTDSLNVANISQAAYVLSSSQDKWRLDFRYDDSNGAGLTFFDGVKPLAFINLLAKPKTGSSTITIDNSGTRTSNMLNGSLTTVTPLAIDPDNETEVTFVSRTTVTGTVRLQGRDTAHPSADTVTFALRQVGAFTTLVDSLFNLNDIDAVKQGVQVKSTGTNGDFTLSNVPPGRWVLTAAVRRYLAGHDTLNVPTGQTTISNVQPVKLRDGTGTELLGGDAAGYSDSLGRSLSDNFINSADINAINSALFKTLGQSGYNTFADINQDSVVNGTDKDFATQNQTSNTGEAGKKMPVFPTFKQVVPEGSNADALVTLTGIPQGEIDPGDTFDVNVVISGAVDVRTYEVHINFDPEKLAFAGLISNGSLFEFYMADMAGNIRGTDLGFVNSIVGQVPFGASGEGTLATIRFKAIARATTTELKLNDVMLIDTKQKIGMAKLGASHEIVLSRRAIAYHDAEGKEIRGLILPDVDPKVDFNDFLTLTRSFGATADTELYDMRADLNGDNVINFADFLLFSQDFNRVAVDAPVLLQAGKMAVGQGGQNQETGVHLRVSDPARLSQALTVDVMVEEAQALSGWGLTVGFDPNQYEFVDAHVPEADLLQKAGNETPVFLVHKGQGEIHLANAIAGLGAVSGDGMVARLLFRPIGEVEVSQFDVLDGVLFDVDQIENPIRPSVLDIRPVPAEFALGQNQPNPFNPETTITYDLASDGQIRLDIYNVTGQRVHTLVNAQQPAGRYRVTWQGDDALGRQLASGVYFYRLETAEFRAVRKLLLLK